MPRSPISGHAGRWAALVAEKPQTRRVNADGSVAAHVVTMKLTPQGTPRTRASNITSITQRKGTRPAPLRKPAELWDGVRISIERFGSDHWEMLRRITADRPVVRADWLSGPTLLADVELYGHTDTDVIEDLAAAGLIYVFWAERRPTPAGHIVRSALHEHLSGGGNYANFEVPTVRRTQMEAV